jgi:hypothetical protein
MATMGGALPVLVRDVAHARLRLQAGISQVTQAIVGTIRIENAKCARYKRRPETGRDRRCS